LPNRRLFDTFEARVALGKVFRRHRPRLVLGFGEKTPLASPDHYQAMQITDAGVFYSRLTKWDQHFESLEVHTVPAYLYYSLSFSGLTVPPGAGHLIVDIGDTLETKLAAVRCYQTQFRRRRRTFSIGSERWLSPRRRRRFRRRRAICQPTGTGNERSDGIFVREVTGAIVARQSVAKPGGGDGVAAYAAWIIRIAPIAISPT